MILKIIWSLSLSFLFLAGNLNLGATVKNSVFFSWILSLCYSKAKSNSKSNTTFIWTYASSLHVGFIHINLTQTYQVKRKNKGMGNFVTAFCSLSVQRSSCVIVSKLRDLGLICVCTACCKSMQVLLYILLYLLWFLWFKQMKTSQGDISPVNTIKEVSEFVFSLQKCIGFYSP